MAQTPPAEEDAPQAWSISQIFHTLIDRVLSGWEADHAHAGVEKEYPETAPEVDAPPDASGTSSVAPPQYPGTNQ